MNRLKVVLAETKHTNRWFAELLDHRSFARQELGKDEAATRKSLFQKPSFKIKQKRYD